MSNNEWNVRNWNKEMKRSRIITFTIIIISWLLTVFDVKIRRPQCAMPTINRKWRHTGQLTDVQQRSSGLLCHVTRSESDRRISPRSPWDAAWRHLPAGNGNRYRRRSGRMSAMFLDHERLWHDGKGEVASASSARRKKVSTVCRCLWTRGVDVSVC